MNARHAARELALLTLFQVKKQGASRVSPDTLSLSEMILASVRALSEQAEELIKESAQDLANVSQDLLTFEADHPDNLARPFDAPDEPVAIPTTREMIEKIEKCLQGAEYLAEALRIPELATLSNEKKVRDYAVKLIQLVLAHEAELDELLNQHCQDWRVERLVKIDREILRLAAAEMKYVDTVDLSVSIDEAVELAKHFSTDESFRFINGVLGQLAQTLSGASSGASDGEQARPATENPEHV